MVLVGLPPRAPAPKREDVPQLTEASPASSSSSLPEDDHQELLPPLKAQQRQQRGEQAFPARRAQMRQSVTQRRESFTVAELSFVQSLLETGDDDDLDLLEENLKDEELFFDPNKKKDSSSNAPKPRPMLSRDMSMGSVRRLNELEKRKSSAMNGQARLWKRASFKVMTANRLLGAVHIEEPKPNTCHESPNHQGQRPSVRSDVSDTSDVSFFDAPETAGMPKAQRSSGAGATTLTSTGSTKRNTDGGAVRSASGTSVSPAGTMPKSTAFKIIAEDALLSDSSSGDASDSNSTDQETKHDGLEEESKELEHEYPKSTFSVSTSTSSRPRPLMTRRASENIYMGEGFEIGEQELFRLHAKNYNPWTASLDDFKSAESDESDEDDEPTAFGDFHIIGTSSDDFDAQPHVMSPPLMHSLQSYLPLTQRGQSFWLKYSLVRDGSSMHTFLQHLRGSQYTIMAMETIQGEVFGAFCGAPWTIQHSYFGTAESFVWRLKSPRQTNTGTDDDVSILEQAKRESDVEVFPYAYTNPFYQICQSDRIAIGGGTPSSPRMVGAGSDNSNSNNDDTTSQEQQRLVNPEQFGFAISFDGDYLLDVSTSPCLTFNNPALSKLNPDGSKMELVNLEVWSLTPCITLKEAELMECRKLFLKRHRTI